MAIKKRLGRGLDNLIAGGIAKNAVMVPEPAKKTPPTKKIPAAEAALPQPDAPTEVKSAPSPAAVTDTAGREPYAEIPIDAIDPNPRQPRRDFAPEHIAELAESIRSEGLLQPILVRPKGRRYELIAGERRWRACQSLKMRLIPARIMEAGDVSTAVITLIENLQRQDLNPMEEANGYATLMRDFNLTQEAVSQRVGKSRPAVANALRLLSLNKEVQGLVAKNLLSAGHAKVLLALEDLAQQLILARRVLEEGLSVRETERLVNRFKEARKPALPVRTPPEVESAAIKDLEKQISSRLNTPVVIKHTPKRGKLVIEYYGNEDLQRILEKMGIF